MQLAELDLLDLVQVPGGLEDDEQRVAVPLELRPLVRLDRVLDGELGQVEQLGQLTELLRLRPVEAQPGQAVLARGQLLAALLGRRRAWPPGVRRSRRRCRSPATDRRDGDDAGPAGGRRSVAAGAGRRVSVERAVSGARRRSVMTDSRRDGGRRTSGGPPRTPSGRGAAAGLRRGGPRDRYWEVRLRTRCASAVSLLPGRRPSEAVVHRVTAVQHASPVRVTRSAARRRRSRPRTPRRRPAGARTPCRARPPARCAPRPGAATGSADSTSVSASTRARRSLPSAVSPPSSQQAALGQRGGLRGPLLVAPAARRLGRLLGEAAAGGGVGDQRLEAVEVGVQQGRDVPVAAVLAQQRRRVPEVEQRLAGPAEVGVPGVERAPLGGERVAGLAQQPGQFGELGRVDGLLAQQPGQRPRARRPSGPRRPAPGRRGSRPAGSCGPPATARSCRRSPSPRPAPTAPIGAARPAK